MSSENGPAFKKTPVTRKTFQVHRRVSSFMPFISLYSYLKFVSSHKMGPLLLLFSDTENNPA